jgi:hypothetical protein
VVGCSPRGAGQMHIRDGLTTDGKLQTDVPQATNHKPACQWPFKSHVVHAVEPAGVWFLRRRSSSSGIRNRHSAPAGSLRFLVEWY